MTDLSYSRAIHVLGRCPMDNHVGGCQPPAGATPLLRFGLPSPPGVVGMLMAPGSASRKHPFYVVCKCGLGCCVCGGRRVDVGVWGRGPLVMCHVRALLVGGGGCVWVCGVKCPCGGSGPHLGWCGCLPLLLWYTTSLCCVLRAVGCWRVSLCASAGSSVLRCSVCYATSALCATLPP